MSQGIEIMCRRLQNRALFDPLHHLVDGREMLFVRRNALIIQREVRAQCYFLVIMITVACLGSGLEFLVFNRSQPGDAAHAQFRFEKIPTKQIRTVFLRGWTVARGGI